MANPDQSWRTRLMTYAFSMFNGVMQSGQNALGSSAGFKGNGMCFSTRGLRRRPWKSYGLVEDMEYSWTLRVAGEKILFVPDVAVYGAMLGFGWKGRRQSAPAVGVRPERHPQEISGPGAAVQRPRLVGKGPLGLRIDHSHHGRTGIDLSRRRRFRSDRLAHDSRFDQPGDASLFGCDARVVMTVALCAYAISPFLAMRLPLRYVSTLLLFPVLRGLEAVHLAGRPPAPVGSDGT